MSWQRIDKTHRLRNTGGEEGIRRVYGRNGKLWPRIVIVIHHNQAYSPNTFTVTCSRKQKSGAWWCSYDGIPLELLSELQEMLKKLQEELENS